MGQTPLASLYRGKKLKSHKSTSLVLFYSTTGLFTGETFTLWLGVPSTTSAFRSLIFRYRLFTNDTCDNLSVENVCLDLFCQEALLAGSKPILSGPALLLNHVAPYQGPCQSEETMHVTFGLLCNPQHISPALPMQQFVKSLLSSGEGGRGIE